MSPNSKIVRYVHKDTKNRDVMIHGLYRDQVTGNFYVRSGGKTRSLETDNFQTAKLRIHDKLKTLTDEPQVKKSNKLFIDYADDIMKIHESQELGSGTMTRYRGIIKHSLNPFFGNLTPSEIDQQTIVAFMKWHKKSRSVQLFNDFKLLKKIIGLMKKEGELTRDLDLSLPQSEKDHHEEAKGTFVERSEFLRILSVTVDDRMKFIFELAYTVGMRKSEIIKLEKSFIKLKSDLKVIELPKRAVKTKRARNIPLTEDLGAQIEHYTRAGVYLFPALSDKSRPIPPQLVDRAWRVAKQKAGIRRHIRFHDLRHTCATNLGNAGFDATRASALLGMSIQVYEKRYLKKNKLDLTSLVNSMGIDHGKNRS